MNVLKVILAILLPPLGVLTATGFSTHFLLNIVLTLLGYFPGMSHAVYIILTR